MNSLQIDLATIFYGVEKKTAYTLRGMITYYGKHYSAYFYCRSRNQWLCFDDAKIKIVGNTWDDVIENCCHAHWQPSVLFYEQKSLKPPGRKPKLEMAAYPNRASVYNCNNYGSNISLALQEASSSAPPIPFSAASSTPPINIMSTSHFLNRYAFLPSSKEEGQRMPRDTKQHITTTTTTILTYNTKNEDGQLHNNIEDIISSPIDDAVDPHMLDDALPPLVASPSVSEIVTSYDDSLTDQLGNGTTPLLGHSKRTTPCVEQRLAELDMCKSVLFKEHRLNSAACNDSLNRPCARVFSCEFVIGTRDMEEREFCIPRSFDAFAKRWVLYLERSEKAAARESRWGKRGEGSAGYISVSVQRQVSFLSAVCVLLSFFLSLSGGGMYGWGPLSCKF